MSLLTSVSRVACWLPQLAKVYTLLLLTNTLCGSKGPNIVLHREYLAGSGFKTLNDNQAMLNKSQKPVDQNSLSERHQAMRENLASVECIGDLQLDRNQKWQDN